MFFQSVSALSCEEGWAGMKFPLTKIEIISNADFNDDYPAGSFLNHLIRIDMCVSEDYYGCDRQYLNLDDIKLEKFMNPQNQYMANLYITGSPTIDKVHKLTIKLFKSNGDLISIESKEIVWQ